MAKIQVLDRHTAELIAAGEVVERPSSVVKELMENAIDAGATSLAVEIENGGVHTIRVTDNGCGIVHDEVTTAFLRHATSKVRTEEDLERIGTLGFRGEALASISAVARVELITRTADELAGTRCVIEGGGEPDVSEIGCPVGTTIFVRDLFYNVPARMKFLKKDVSEANAVAAVVDCLALSHPEISVRFVRDGKETLLTPGDGNAHSCIYAVFGREFANGLIPVDYALGGVHVYGYISKPVNARSNRTMQHFFVNGRYVKTRTAAAALERAFQGNIMIGKFPSCVLHVDMAAELVDANVHPAKIEVRFVNERPVFDAVYHGVKSALMAGDTPKQVSFTAAKVQEVAPVTEQVHFTVPEEKSAVTPAAPATNGFKKRPLNPETAPAEQPSKPMPLRDRTALLYGKPDITVDAPSVSVPTPPMPKPVVSVEKPIEHTAVDTTPPVLDTEPITYLGEVYCTYLLVQKGESLFFIDKHAAHERILYNKLRQTEHKDAQLLLTPVTVPLSHKEYEAILPHLALLSDAGFEVEEFDGTVLVRSVPMMLTGEDVPALIEEIADGFLSGKQEIELDKLSWIYHSVACRAAVKAGDRQSPLELETLARRVLTDDAVRYCPHGRPVCFELTRKELEKQFGRI